MNGPFRCQVSESKEVYNKAHLFRPLEERDDVKNIEKEKKEMTSDFSTPTAGTRR